MTALFSSSWTGMSFIEDMDTGVMDRFLTAPVPRGALIAASLAYQAVTTVVQSAIIIAIGWGIGAGFPGGAAGVAALIGVSVLIALAMAGLSDGLRAAGPAARGADRRVHHAGAAADVPVRRVPVAAARPRLDRRHRQVQPGQLGGQRRARRRRRLTRRGARSASYAGFLALALVVTAAMSTRAFRLARNSPAPRGTGLAKLGV